MKKEAADYSQIQKQETKYAAKVGGKKETISELIRRTIPPTMIPTKKTSWIFGTIFLIVIIIGILSFPLDKLMAAQIDVVVNIGLPWPFLVFDLLNPEKLPLKITNLLLDLGIYIILAYAIDVAINNFSKATSSNSKTTRPSAYKIPKQNLPQKLAEKTTKAITKNQKKISN